MNFSKAVLIAMMASVSTPNAFAALRKTRGLLRGVANRQLSLAHVNADPNDDAPFGICEGDCDTDDDCEVGLLCFQRNSTQPVPGCEGGEQDTTPSDYCILDVTPAPSVSSAPSQQPSTTFSPSQAPSESVQPSAAPSESFKPSTSANPSLAPTPKPLGLLFAYPEEGPPTDAYPLGLCVGDCDTDDQCAEGLFCFLRVANTAVPGCIGGEEDNSRTDYCTYIIPTVHPSAVPSSQPSVAPTPSPSEIPTSSESSKPSSNSANPTDQPTLSLAPSIKTLGTLFAYPGEGPPADAYPLGLCVGDCDTDDQCAEGLFCFLHVANTAVPGCIGGEEDNSRTDYCTYIIPTAHPSAVPSSQPSVAPTPSPSEIPTSSESSKPSSSAKPTDPPTLSLASSTTKTLGTLFAYPGEGPPADAYPLGLCVGDCDTDDQCAEGLFCFLRVANTAVPGCIGGEEDNSRTDYCTYIIPTVHPSAVPSSQPSVAPTPSPSEIPTSLESSKPSFKPSLMPSAVASSKPSTMPSSQPTISSKPSICTPTVYEQTSATTTLDSEGYAQFVFNDLKLADGVAVITYYHKGDNSQDGYYDLKLQQTFSVGESQPGNTVPSSCGHFTASVSTHTKNEFNYIYLRDSSSLTVSMDYDDDFGGNSCSIVKEVYVNLRYQEAGC
jgi:hypothetical protein